jgi:hypothetical protein
MIAEKQNFSTYCHYGVNCRDFQRGRCKFQHYFTTYESYGLMYLHYYEPAFIVKETCRGIDSKHCKKVGCKYKHIDTIIYDFCCLHFGARETILEINKDYNRSKEIVECLEQLHVNLRIDMDEDNIDNIISKFLKKYVNNKLTENSGITNNLIKIISKSNNNINSFINNMKIMIYNRIKCNRQLDQIKKNLKKIINDSENFVKQLNLDYESEIINISKSCHKSFEIAKKTEAERIEKDLCENHGIVTVCEFTAKNNATCSICFSSIFDESECDVISIEPKKAIIDDDLIYCTDCVKNIIKTSNFYNIGKEKEHLPGIKCPFANTKKNHNHRISVIAITMALAQALPKNETTEIYDLISNATTKYHHEQTQNQIRKKIAEIEKEGVTSVSYLVQQIQNRILIDACPNCHRAYEFIGGCQSIICRDEYNGKGCGWNFCNVCLEHCNQYTDTHHHVANCIQSHNLNGVDAYFLSTTEGQKWRMKHRCQRIRKFLNSQPSGINYSGVLVVLYQNEIDLRKYILDEFKEYSVDIIGR